MAVIRSYDKHFIDVRRSLGLRTDLSFSAKGVLLSLLSVPKDLELDTDSIHEYFRVGEGELLPVLEELVSEGYIVITREEDGGYTSNIYDEPQNVEDAEEGDED